MDRKDFARISQEVKESIEKAVDSIPYEEIGKKVSEGMERAGQKIREGYEQEENRRYVKPGRKNYRNRGRNGRMGSSPYGDVDWSTGQDSSDWTQKEEMDWEYHRQPVVFSARPKGRFSWFFSVFFGIFFCVIMGAGWLSSWLMSLIYGHAFSILDLKSLSMLLFFGAGVYMMVRGTGIRGRLKRFQLYKKRLEGKEYCELSVLGRTTGKSVRYLRKDLKKMIELGMFPEGHLDEKGTCLILTTRAYKQYLMMMEAKARKEQEQAERAARKEEEEKKKEAAQEERFAGVDEERRAQIKKIIKEGENYLYKFEMINERLTGEIISRKLSRLSLVTGRIFDFITEHPQKVGEIRKFMSYYLPTTEKLLNTYEELDTELVQGENILKAKKEIEDTLDTINFAFENLLDSLYEDTIMDISTDIAVLETMLAQEGLTEQEL